MRGEFRFAAKLDVLLASGSAALHHARELGDDRVAPGVDDAPIVALDQRRHGGSVTAQRL